MDFRRLEFRLSSRLVGLILISTRFTLVAFIKINPFTVKFGAQPILALLDIIRCNNHSRIHSILLSKNFLIHRGLSMINNIRGHVPRLKKIPRFVHVSINRFIHKSRVRNLTC